MEYTLVCWLLAVVAGFASGCGWEAPVKAWKMAVAKAALALVVIAYGYLMLFQIIPNGFFQPVTQILVVAGFYWLGYFAFKWMLVKQLVR